MGPVAGPQQYQDISCGDSARPRLDGARLIAGGDDGSSAAATATSFARRSSPASGRDMELFSRRDLRTGAGRLPSSTRSTRRWTWRTTRSTGLSSAIFTKTSGAAKRYIDGIEAGLAHVNVHTGYKEPSMPFGGVKQSGAGLPENSQSGLEAFVDRKAVYLRG